MTDIRKDKLLTSHSKIFRTYKDLIKLLPYGFIKIRVSKGQKYYIKAQPPFFNLEKEKNKETNPNKNKNNNDFLHNKNIYLYSKENENIKKMMTKMKSYYTHRKPHKNRLVKSESNIKSHPNINIEKINSNLTSSKTSIKEKTNSLDKTCNNLFLNIKTSTEYSNKIDSNLDRNKNKQFIRSFSTSNWLMKNNILLPSITNRLKNSIPRYLRETNGFMLIGHGIYNLKNLTSNNKSRCHKIMLIKDNNNYEKLKFTQTDIGQYIWDYDTKNYNEEGKNFSKKNKKIKSLKKLLKNNENVMGLKTIYKRINNKNKNNII